MQKIIVLLLEAIILIVKMKVTPEEATRATADKYGVDFSKLWEAIPRRWK